MAVKEIIDKCEELYNDLHFHSVKEWKEKTGGKAIGYMPVYVPREIIHAAGMLPVGIMGGGNNIEIIKGDAFFQSYICHIPRSTIEMGVSGRLDSLDGMLFPAICDVIRNLSGMWQMLFANKYVRYMDFPQNFDASIGGSFYRHEMSSLLNDLSKMSGKKVTDDDLRKSIALFNENRNAIENVYRQRAEVPHLIKTAEVYLLLRAGLVMDVEEHTKLLNRYLAEVIKQDRPVRDHVRVVVSGAFCEQPPLELVKSLENSGCYIVDDDWVLGTRFLTKDVSVIGDPLDALSDAYLNHTVEMASKYEGEQRKGDFLVSRVKDLKAEGVIFAAPSFCDPALLERPMLADVMTRENIPYTSFKYAENTGQFNIFKEQSGTFADSIKLWGGV